MASHHPPLQEAAHTAARMYRNFVNDLLPHDKKFIPTTFVSQLLSNHSSNGVSKLYRFSSNNPSSIALISVVMLSAHVDPIIVDIEKRTQGNMLRVEPTQGEVSCMRLIKNRVFFSPSKQEKSVPIMHQRRGSPISRHAPFISPSEYSPQIYLGRAPASGPSILRIGSRVSPSMCTCAIAATKKQNKQTTYPVAKTTASASSVLPSANSRPFSVKFAIWASFLSLIFPSIISWLAPTSVLRVRCIIL